MHAFICVTQFHSNYSYWSYTPLFFLSNFIYVFLAVLGLRCCADLSPIVEGGCSLFAAHRLLIVVASLIERPGLYSIGSTVVGQGLTCSAACGILPDQGWSPCFLHWQADPLPLRHQGSLLREGRRFKSLSLTLTLTPVCICEAIPPHTRMVAVR